MKPSRITITAKEQVALWLIVAALLLHVLPYALSR